MPRCVPKFPKTSRSKKRDPSPEPPFPHYRLSEMLPMLGLAITSL
jgi:hypothetical protein